MGTRTSAPGTIPLRHPALVYRDLDGFLAATVPFVRQGLGRGEPVAVAVGPDELRALGEQVDGDRAVVWADTNEWQTRPANRLRAIHRLVSDQVVAGAPTIRLIGEPLWPSGPPEFTLEWARYESALNAVLAPFPVEFICTYPASRLAPEIVEHASLTHPIVADGAAETPSAAFEDPRELLARLNLALGPVPASAATLAPPIDAPAARAFAAAFAGRARLTPERSAELGLAVSEVVVNGDVHGGGVTGFGIWTEDGHVVCQVDDAGTGIADPLAGYVPPPRDRSAGRGLWLARQVVNLLRIVSGPQGTSVRMHVALETR